MPLTHLTDVDGLAPGPGFPHAVVTTGRLAFVSGQVATGPDGELVGPGDLAAQTRQALDNLGRIVTALGATWADVARFGWYVLDTRELPALRAARDEVLGPVLGDRPAPASSLVQVAGLFRPGFLVEVDAVVAVPER